MMLLCGNLVGIVVFSVKSSYFFVMESVLNNQYHKKVGNSSWIWKLKVPNQVRVFLWRVVRGCIPMRQNL